MYRGSLLLRQHKIVEFCQDACQETLTTAMNSPVANNLPLLNSSSSSPSSTPSRIPSFVGSSLLVQRFSASSSSSASSSIILPSIPHPAATTTPRVSSSGNIVKTAVRKFSEDEGAKTKSFSNKDVVQENTPLTETIRDFLDPASFYSLLRKRGIDFYTGVPDSLLKDFCAYVTDNTPADRHVITANEGSAIALAAGYHLATKKFPIVYMQNSGFGNAVNPLLSLVDPKIYNIPMLLLIGWRGEPGKKDEPQHLVQGKVMSNLLADMNIRFEVLPDYIEGAEEAVDTAFHHLVNRGGPYAFLVRRQCFTKYKLKNKEPDNYTLSREEAIKILVDNCDDWDVLVATTGFTSRELYEYRDAKGQDHSREFLTVGSMGHASAIAMGIALSKKSRQVICVDGDGAALMHMGTMATVGTVNPAVNNFKHVLINNGSHDSVGGQPTQGFKVDFLQVARACGYKEAMTASTPEEIAAAVKKMRQTSGPVLLEIRVNKGARANLGRPKQSPIQNKAEFMRFLEG